MPINPELEDFLAAQDLDDALSALERIRSLDASDAATIRAVIDQWENQQAVSNLLFYPMLLPSAVRLAALFRGLAERRVTYYVLAAVVGFQKIDTSRMDGEQRARVVDELLPLVRDAKGIIAHRASVSVQPFLTEDAAARVAALAPHVDDTTWHNLRAWLFRTFRGRGTDAFAALISESALSEGEQQRLLEEFVAVAAKPPQSFDPRLSELLGYIPNLRDVENAHLT